MDELTTHGDRGPRRPRKLPCLPRSDGGTLRRHRAFAHGRSGAAARLAGQDQAGAAALRHRELQPRSTKPVHPATAIAALRKVYPRNGVVLIDSGAHRAFAGHYWNCVRAAHLHLGHQSRADGLGDPGGDRRAMRAARPPRRGHHRRRLHAHARDGSPDRGALRPSHRLRRLEQLRARKRLAARPSIRCASRPS